MKSAASHLTGYASNNKKTLKMPDHNSPFPILSTKRLRLRPLSEQDANEIFSLRSDAQINKYLDRKLNKTLGDSLDFIKTIHKNTGNSALKYWAITMKDNEKLIGTICLFSFSDELKKCEIGYELLTEYQGQGIMSEASAKVTEYAFEELGLKTIEAYTHKDNKSSTGLLLKAGFAQTTIVDERNPDLIIFRKIQ